MDERRNIKSEGLGIIDTIFFIILFVPLLLMDLFDIMNETTEYERRCQDV